jgi:hypothetical protein
MAQTAIRNDELCRAQYARLRAVEKKHGRALRGVADRLLRILVGALRSGTLYDINCLRPGHGNKARGACGVEND